MTKQWGDPLVAPPAPSVERVRMFLYTCNRCNERFAFTMADGNPACPHCWNAVHQQVPVKVEVLIPIPKDQRRK